MEKHSKAPSSGTAGFFQVVPHVESAFEEDAALKRVFNFYLPADVQKSISGDLSRFGNLVLSRNVIDWIADAEKNVPHLRTWETFGRRVDELITSNGWRSLQDLGLSEGIVSIAYERTYAENSRLYQFLKYHIWSGSCAVVTCPSAMQDGAARLLQLQLAKKDLPEQERKVFASAFAHLTSRIPSQAWTSGQWMTERPGGSDVRNTETQATYDPAFAPTASRIDADGMPLGPYSISGFKWFSSATDASMTVLLAREPSGSISTFYAPMRRRLAPTTPAHPHSSPTELNGVTIQRLKNKLGTKPVPTAELVLDNMRAWRIGTPGAGVKEISTVLNITRVHNAISAVGFLGRGLSVARAFARVRESSGRVLLHHPAHVRTLANQHVRYRAMMHLSFFTVALLGLCENLGAVEGPGQGQGRQMAAPAVRQELVDAATAPALLRIMTPLIKMLTARTSIAGLAECMEALGGVGYLENEDPLFNIARLFRDANVLSIWEGTTNVMAGDLVRVFKGSSGTAVIGALDGFVKEVTARWVGDEYGRVSAKKVSEAWEGLRKRVEGKGKEELLHKGREIGDELGWILCAILLREDAASDGDDVSLEVWKRWVDIKGEPVSTESNWTDTAKWDMKVAFGDEKSDKARL